MPKSFADVHDTFKELEKEYMQRHSDHRKLRGYFHGKFWQEADEEASGISSLFRDLRGRSNEVGPDLKLVHNLLMEVVTRFQTFLCPLPMINVPTDPPMSERNRARATTKERYLYGLWAMGNMNQVAADIGWYLPLMGDCFLGAIPDPDTKLVTPVLRSPEYAYPVPSFMPGKWDGIIFRWEISEEAARRAFPGWTPRKGRKNKTGKVEIIEWHDTNEWDRFIDGTRVNGVVHEYGFNLFQQLKFIPVPDEMWGHGAVEQTVGMVEMGNALKSLNFQAVFENVFPRLVLENPMKFGEEIPTGPGAVIGVNEGGKAYFLNPPTQTLQATAGFAMQNDQAIKETAFMPDVNRGKFDASIITGKAINELQGAGTGGVVEMVQGVCMGPPLVGWNERAICIGQKTFVDSDIHLHGHITPGMMDVKPQYFAMNIKGKDLKGSWRNEVVFQPHIDVHGKMVMGLQGLSGGLVSKRYVREQIGVSDSAAMEEEIFAERIEEGVLAAALTAMETAAAEPEQVEQQGFAYINQTGPAPVGNLGGAGLPFPMPGVPNAPPAGAAPQASPAGMPPTAAPPPPQGAGPGAAELSAAKAVTLDEAIAALQTVADVQGRVFLVGEIVTQGQTQDDIEIAVTVPEDRQTISAALPEFAGMLFFTVVDAEPREQFIEVTPGADPVQGGAEPTLEELMAGA